MEAFENPFCLFLLKEEKAREYKDFLRFAVVCRRGLPSFFGKISSLLAKHLFLLFERKKPPREALARKAENCKKNLTKRLLSAIIPLVAWDATKIC